MPMGMKRPFRYIEISRRALAFVAVMLTVVVLDAGSFASAQEAPAPPGDPPTLRLPVECELGNDCWVFNYFDHHPEKRIVRDYACGGLASDRHRGTEFVVRDELSMEIPINVLAAADGKVSFVRNSMPDGDYRKMDPKTVGNRICGNAVQIIHGGDWKTRYCHLRNGSVTVKAGQKVVAGTKIGEIGYSGRAAYPQVEFSVFHGRKSFVDPFHGLKGGSTCGMGKAPLWDAKTQKILKYASVLLYNAGFASKRPFVKTARDGTARMDKISANSLKLFYFVEVRNLRKGDRLSFKIIGPGEEVVRRITRPIKKSAFRKLQVVDVTSRGSWPPGIYRGEVVLKRKSKSGSQSFRTSAEVDVR